MLVDLGAERTVAAIVLQMGAYAFGHPRVLDVDLSSDGTRWSRTWSGDTSAIAVRGAVARPDLAPIVIDFTPARGRYIRLQQSGNEPGIPWWIAELLVHAPAQ